MRKKEKNCIEKNEKIKKERKKERKEGNYVDEGVREGMENTKNGSKLKELSDPHNNVHAFICKGWRGNGVVFCLMSLSAMPWELLTGYRLVPVAHTGTTDRLFRLANRHVV